MMYRAWLSAAKAVRKALRLCTSGGARHKRAVSASLILLVFAAISDGARAQQGEIVSYPSRDGTMLTARLYRPPGTEAKAPAVVALHGCGGSLNRTKDDLSARHLSWARILANAGYVVVFPDSFASRGHGSLCKVKPRPVRQEDRVEDVAGTISWLKTQAFVSGDDISLLGWSNGGTTAINSALADFATQLRQVIAMYPGCRQIARHDAPKPATRLTILMGAADDWTAPGPCIEIARRWGVPIVLYPGAYHSFDTSGSIVRQRDGLAFTAKGEGRAHAGSNYPARRQAIAAVLTALAPGPETLGTDQRR